MYRRLEEPMATQRVNYYLPALPAFNFSGQHCLSGRCHIYPTCDDASAPPTEPHDPSLFLRNEQFGKAAWTRSADFKTPRAIHARKHARTHTRAHGGTAKGKGEKIGGADALLWSPLRGCCNMQIWTYRAPLVFKRN